jgi:hypothetical protein
MTLAEVDLCSSEKKPLITLNYSGVITVKAHDILDLSGTEFQLDFGKHLEIPSTHAAKYPIALRIGKGSTTFKVLQTLLDKMNLTKKISIQNFAKFLVTLPYVCGIGIKACRDDTEWIEGKTCMDPIEEIQWKK